MLKSVMSDTLILQPSVRTMVPSVSDIFLTLPEVTTIAPPLLCSSGTKYLMRASGCSWIWSAIYAKCDLRGNNHKRKSYKLCSKRTFWDDFQQAFFIRLLCSLFFKNERFDYLSVYFFCVKSYSLTLYEFFNRQGLSAIETERNKRFYSKHTR